MLSNTKKATEPERLSKTSNIIGQDTHLEGHLNTKGNLRVEGKVNGSVRTTAKVVLGDTAIVEGNITAKTAEIGGQVKGMIEVASLLTLKPTAVIQGDIITNKLVFEEGAQFDGTCKMNAPSKAPDEKKFMQSAASKKTIMPTEPILHKVVHTQQESHGT